MAFIIKGVNYTIMEHFYKNVEGWFTWPNFYKAMVDRYKNGRFLEVGCYLGQSVSYLGVEVFNSKKNIEIYCVDSFGWNVNGKPMQDIFLENIKPIENLIKPMKLDSISASKRFRNNSLEMVFLDAGEDYESVTEDIKAWWPKIKINGILAGHDYWSDPSNETIAGVNVAVNEFAEKNKLTLKTFPYEGVWAAVKRI